MLLHSAVTTSNQSQLCVTCHCGKMPFVNVEACERGPDEPTLAYQKNVVSVTLPPYHRKLLVNVHI